MFASWGSAHWLLVVKLCLVVIQHEIDDNLKHMALKKALLRQTHHIGAVHLSEEERGAFRSFVSLVAVDLLWLLGKHECTQRGLFRTLHLHHCLISVHSKVIKAFRRWEVQRDGSLWLQFIKDSRLTASSISQITARRLWPLLLIFCLLFTFAVIVFKHNTLKITWQRVKSTSLNVQNYRWRTKTLTWA